MLIVVSPENKNKLLDKLILNNVPTFEIGYFTKNIYEKIIYNSKKEREDISEPESDELYKVI
jgi:hydrogenase maturation factor